MPVTTVSKVTSVLISISKVKEWCRDGSYTVLLNVAVLEACQLISSSQRSITPTQKTSSSPADLRSS